MEFVEGISLEQLLKKVEIVPLEIVIFITLEALKGLAYAHSKRIFHRDIKPGNILLSNHGHVKITDFGLALIPDSKTITIQNSILGTPAYMSPEQICGEKLDGRSDIFSLGATMYEMLIKKQAFAGKTYSESLNNVLNREPVKLKNLRPDLAADVDIILNKMIHKKRAQRFEKCEIIINELAYYAQQINLDLSKQNLRSFIKDPKNYSNKEHLQKTNVGTKQKLIKWAAIITVLAALMINVSYIVFVSDAGKQQISNNVDLKNDSLLSAKKENLKRATNESNKIIQQPIQNNSANLESTDLSSRKNINILKNNELSANKNKSLEKPIPTKKQATLLIKCAPWAKVFFDDQFQKTLYEFDSLIVKTIPGEHEVVFINPEFAPYDTGRKIIKLSAGQIQKLIIPFVEIAGLGFLKITVNPWAEVFVNQINKGITPLEPIILEHGKHHLILKHPQLKIWEKNVVIKTGETCEISVDLMQAIDSK